MTTVIVRFVNVISAALLAGISFGIWVGFNPTDLPPETFVEQQQNMLLRLKGLMIFLVVTVTFITIVSAFLQKHDKPVFITLLIAAGFMIVCMLVTRFGNNPIDDLVMSWNPDALPSNWAVLRDRWLSLHIIRIVSELAALFLVTWASIRKGEIDPRRF